MNKTLEPEAQAFTITKITSDGLRTDYHRFGKDRFVALVQLQEAKAMAKTLHDRLTNEDGLVATLPPGGPLMPPAPGEQAAALWAYSSLSLALSDPSLPLYQKLPGTNEDAARYREWADSLFVDSQALQPETPRDFALTIKAYGWFAAATENRTLQRQALETAGTLAERLRQEPTRGLVDVAWSVHGLGEAGRLTGDGEFGEASRRLFFEEMEPLWDSGAGVYADRVGETRHAYTPEKTAAVFAAIQTIRLTAAPGVGSEGSPELLDQRYVTFFQNAVVRSGLQQAHAIRP